MTGIDGERFDVIVCGAGVIGAAIAWRLAITGRHVGLVDADPGRGASYAAAGMLAPVAEAAFGEERLLELNLRAAERWPSFAAELSAASGEAIGYEESGTLLVAFDPGDRSLLANIHAYHQELGLEARWCTASECRRLEPALAPGVHAGVLTPTDARVDNRRVLAALATACARAGVTFVPARAEALLSESGAVRGVVTAGRELRTGVVVVATGEHVEALAGLPAGAVPPLHPVKGQILRLRMPLADPLLERTVHAYVEGSSVYVVPRGDGRIVVGATVEERGDDLRVTAGGTYQLLRDALRVLPGLDDAELVEATARLRPGSPDNAPLVGGLEPDGLVLAAGHYRNGFLLAPVTADAIVALLDDGVLPPWALPFSPARFAAAGAAKA